MTAAIQHTQEPWAVNGLELVGADGTLVAKKDSPDDPARLLTVEASLKRAAACVNALAGAEDPKEHLTRLRNTLSHTVDHLRKMLEKVAGSSGIMLKVDQDAARNQARRAEALLREIDNR